MPCSEKMKQRTKKIALLLSVCIVVMLVTAYILTDRHDMLQRSQKVAVITGWAEFHPILNPLAFQYTWLSDDTLLFARENGKDEMAIRNFFRRNIAKNTEEEIYPLSTLMRHVDARHGILLSQDSSSFVARGLSLEYAGLVNWKRNQLYSLHTEEGSWVWLRDGRNLALMGSENQSSFSVAVIRSMASPLKTKRMRFKSDIPFAWNSEIADCGDHFSIFVHGDYNTQDKTADVYESGLGTEPYKEHKHTIHLPDEAELFECHLSPKGDKVAFLLSFEQERAWEKILVRFFPTYTQIKQRRMELWVSDLKGETYSLGEIKLPRTSKNSRMPYSIKWLPDGKRMSYIYDNAIWITSTYK